MGRGYFALVAAATNLRFSLPPLVLAATTAGTVERGPGGGGTRASNSSSVLKAGVRIYYDVHSQWLGSWYATKYATWERGTFRVFERFVQNDSIVLDVGAWIGPTCLWLAHKARHTVCLEPTTTAFTALQRNLQQNTDLRPHAVHLVNAALSNTQQVAVMTNSGDSMDQLALERRRRLSQRKTSVNVTTITIDDLER